jgi:MerR family transcriptional regulator/heat shock protein HspR
MELMVKDRDPVFAIGVVAKMFDISVHTLRLYEAEGLILPYKTDTNRRLYSQADVNRIACIRNMLEEKGLNIAGIKWMLSMIPCWDLLPCSEEDRKVCPAYTDSTNPCWMVEHKAERCANQDCRECEVYQSTSNCSNFKQYLKDNWK